MSRRIEATPDNIRESLIEISNFAAIDREMRMRLEIRESSLTTDNRIMWVDTIPEDHGDHTITNGHRNAMVAANLEGEALRLRKGSLVRYESFVVPENKDVLKSIHEYSEYKRNDPEKLRSFGMIALKEWRGIFNVSAVDHQNYYFETETKGLDVAVEGLATYLNTPLLNMNESELIQKDVRKARAIVKKADKIDFSDLFNKIRES